MVHFATALLGVAAVLSRQTLAAPMPRPDSSINEPAVEAPNGVPVTLGADGEPTGNADINNMPTMTMSSSYGSGGYGGGGYGGNYGGGYGGSSSQTASSTYTTSMMYGSGYNNWNSGYNGCVQQGVNSYAAPPAMYTPPPSPPSENNNGGGGSGNAHTVIVAPAQGILRFVPFAVNASIGDTIHFVWGGSPHTVTKSSILTPCNKSADSTDFFASGVQNKSFTFDITVNSTTDPTVYYCGVPGHCPKGMFGFVNPPNAFGGAMTVSQMMPAMIANNSDFATQAMYTANKTMNTSAYTWGDNMDMTDVPPELHQTYLENVMMTRLMFAANPGMLEAGKGAANPDGSAIAVPGDITQITTGALVNSGAGSSSTATDASSTGASSATSAAPSATTSAKKSGAVGRSVGSAGAIAAIAILVSFFTL